MHRVQGVSFPRSGHHLLVRCLQQYSGKRLGYRDNVFRRQDFPGDGITLQKNHDFNLLLPISPDARYLIQYRRPLEAIASWYRWEVKHGIAAEHNHGWRPAINRHVPIWNLYTTRNNRKRWTSFLESKILFWSGFMEKWVTGNTHSASCFVDYSDLIRNPFDTISRVALFLDPETPLNAERLNRIIASNNIEIRNDIRDFEFYDEGLLKDLDELYSATTKAIHA